MKTLWTAAQQGCLQCFWLKHAVAAHAPEVGIQGPLDGLLTAGEGLPLSLTLLAIMLRSPQLRAGLLPETLHSRDACMHVQLDAHMHWGAGKPSAARGWALAAL